MDKTSKLYKKAVERYNDGDLNKALDFCEKSISLSLNNSAALNLKGLMLYLKGEIEEARNLWKLNKDQNRDEVSKKYLESLEEDEEKLRMYKQALKYMESMEFREALVLLKECADSDFNAINVNNSLCRVYIHLGNYVQAKACIDKVLSINKLDKTALENKKLLIDYKVIEKQHNWETGAIFASIIIIAAGALFIAPAVRNIGRHNDTFSKNSKTTADKVIPANSINEVKEKKEDDVKSTDKEKQEEGFPKAEIDAAIGNKDYNSLANFLGKINAEKLKEADKETFFKGDKLLKTDGTLFFYNNARSLHTAKKYEEAILNYERVIKYGEQSYLYPNAIFMTGACYEALGNQDKEIEYYSQYLNSKYDEIYKNNYNSTILYSLVLIYKDSDHGKAKTYAEQIRNNYGDSIYNNSVVDSVLKQVH